jgi:transposase
MVVGKEERAMPRAKIIDAALAGKAKAALDNQVDQRLCLKLQAIVAAAEHPMTMVAEVMGVCRQTLWGWIKNFRQHGIDGLRDRPKGHRQTKLGPGQLGQIARWIEAGRDSRGQPVHWTLATLQHEIKKRFGVRVGLTPLWRQVRRQDFRLLVPRPVHAKADKAAQQRFKKKLPR